MQNSPQTKHVSDNQLITDSDREVLLAIGRIKRHKQRPSIHRLYNICNQIKDKFPQFCTRDGIESVLNHMISRSLLQKVHNEKGLISYRELNSAIAIVAITNPKRSRAKSVVPVMSETIDNNKLSLNSDEIVTDLLSHNSMMKTINSKKEVLKTADVKKTAAKSGSKSKNEVTIDNKSQMINHKRLRTKSRPPPRVNIASYEHHLKPDSAQDNKNLNKVFVPQKSVKGNCFGKTGTQLKAQILRKFSIKKKYNLRPKITKQEIDKKSKSRVVAKVETNSSSPELSANPLTQWLQKRQDLSKRRMCCLADCDSSQLITCSLCGISAHSQCLGCPEQLLNRIKQFPYWECPDCKKCLICNSHDNDLIVCNACDRGFHQKCIQTSDVCSIMGWIDCNNCNPNLINSIERKASIDSLLISIEISPINQYNNEDLESILIKAGLELPEKWSAKKYRKKLIKIIKQESPQVPNV